MRNFIFKLLPTLFCFFILHSTAACFAMDNEGCLTCHQYPGLAIHEKSGTMKVLHIDEAKYIGSPHGELACKECHKKIVKVPHTGVSEVDCTTECHQKDKEKIVTSKKALNNFHKKEQSCITSLKDRSSCGVCHPLYPHSKNNIVRAFLNLHTGFMLCEVCHMKKDEFKGLSYEWMGSETAAFSGEPFGTHFNPELGKASKSKNFISRVAAFGTKEGKKQLLINTWDVAKAKEYLETEKSLTPGEKTGKLDLFHKDIAKKEISVACNECHSENSILDYTKLGFEEKKIKDLIYLNIKGLVTKYKVFYFPNLFGM
jgi:hypothetical protein